jgi:hypothetical protein
MIETPVLVLVGVTLGGAGGAGDVDVEACDAGAEELNGAEAPGRVAGGLGTPPLGVSEGVGDDDDGLWLGEPLSQLGAGDGESLADAEGSAAPLDAPVPVESVGPAAGDPPVGVGDPVQGVPEDVVSARLGLAGITSRAPSATDPVATTPTTDAADRPRRACFGTVITPSCRLLPSNSDHAPFRAHRPP